MVDWNCVRRGRSRRARAALLAVTAVLAAMLSACSWQSGGGATGTYTSFQGSTPPSFGSGGTWFNTDGPFTLEGLKGQVVWIEFSFLG